MEYRKPVTGELIVRCNMPGQQERDEFIGEFRLENKAKWQVEASALDEKGAIAVHYTGKYYGKI
jgi:hypothetical protein